MTGKARAPEGRAQMEKTEGFEGKNSYAQLLRCGRTYLEAHGIEDAQTDSWLLLSHVAGFSRAVYYLRSGDIMPEEQIPAYRELIEKRGSHIPLQYLTGTAYFMGFEFKVTPDVLIPRMDTETLAGEAVKFLKRRRDVCKNKTRVLDLCTGSGCLAVSLKLMEGNSEVSASDISPEALAVARGNAGKYGAAITFIESDLFEKIDGKFDLIVSNPPYIREDVIPGLAREVKDHEPHLALSGGKSGLDFYRRICREAPEHLAPGGALMMEIGYDQYADTAGLMTENGFMNVRRVRDLSGQDRVVTGIKGNV